MKVFGTVRTVSPRFTPDAMSANLSASVPLPTATECFVLQWSAKSLSNVSTGGPPMNLPSLRASLTRPIISSSSSRFGETRSRNGILRLFIYHAPQYFCRVAGHYGIRRDVPGDEAACAYDGILPDHDL